ncbi:MAG: hypothetical protein EYC70_05655 [Planctomycetota bacterium]|nr:MAG: hypothetical protein EYC70_05655 [Planctomycetota bacterium]
MAQAQRNDQAVQAYNTAVARAKAQGREQLERYAAEEKSLRESIARGEQKEDKELQELRLRAFARAHVIVAERTAATREALMKKGEALGHAGPAEGNSSLGG